MHGENRFQQRVNCSRGYDCFIFVYDVTNESSFEEAMGYVDQVERCSTGKSVKLIIGNKADLDQHRKVTHKQASHFGNLFGAHVIELSAKEDKSVQSLFDCVCESSLRSFIEEGKHKELIGGWSTIIHRYYSESFRKVVERLLLCFHRTQSEGGPKVPKVLKFFIIQRIDHKAFEYQSLVISNKEKQSGCVLS